MNMISVLFVISRTSSNRCIDSGFHVCFILNHFILSLNHLIIISKIEDQCVHLGDFSRIIVGFYWINGLKSGKVEVHDNAVVGSQSILLPGFVVENDVILSVLLVAPIHSVIKRGGVWMGSATPVNLAANTLKVKLRYSHRIGVNGKGVLNIYDDIKGFPNHKIFHLGTRYLVIVRHSNGLRSYDDARLDAHAQKTSGQDHMPVALKDEMEATV
uniref:AMP-dependent synthetase/ligase n=1 Tax=Tanacetum cinerariifolium TaxID=118510 RepID=A0A6L2NBF1_TANCI|nr:AMP-dependent synthetase/ligase [Tanacetum cinerariifolium]